MNKPLITAGALLLGALVFDAPQATADVRVHLGGGVSIRTTPRVRWSRPVYRPYYRPSYAIGGAIWVGGGYYSGYGSYRTYAAPPPAPSCDCGPAAVPSYYPGYYPGYYQQAPAQYTVAPQERATLPRFAIGAFLGGTTTELEGSDDAGLFARLRPFGGGLILEGEIAGSSQGHHVDGQEPDSRVAASLIYEIGAENRWAPYVVGSMGALTDQYNATNLGFAEIGGGIRWALTDHLHLAADLRLGAREKQDAFLGDPEPLDGAAARVVTPITEEDQSDGYTHARLSAMFYF